MFEQWIRLQHREIQLEALNRFSHYLSNSELLSVMSAVKDGLDMVDAHINLGLFDKYRTDLFTVRQIITENYHERVVG